MSEKQDEIEVISEVTEEKNEQEHINKKIKMNILKNGRLKKVVPGLGCIVIGIVIGIFIGREDIANDYNSLIDEYNALVEQIDEQESKISELQSKVDTAKPWFDMKDEEKRKIEEQNAKLIAEKNAEAEKKTEEARKKAEEDKLAKEEKEKNKYNTELTYDEIARNPEQTLLKNCKFKGEVVQVLEGDGTNNLRVAINGDYDKMMLVEYSPSIVNSRILEKDNVTLYGTSAGTTSYTSTMGQKITIPAISADKIDIN